MRKLAQVSAIFLIILSILIPGQVLASAPTITITSEVIPDVDTTTCAQTGNITATGGQPVTTRGFEYDDDGSGAPYTYDAHTDGTYGTGSFTIVLTSLSPDTTYYIRAYATNIDGTGYSAETTFHTPPANCYWVPSAGGTASGNWSDDDNHWSDTDDGASRGDGHLPGISSHVHFNANSGFIVGDKTVTQNTTAYFADMDWTGAANNPIFACSQPKYNYGDITLVAGMTWTDTSSLWLISATTKYITTNGASIGSVDIAINDLTHSGEIVFQDAFTTTGDINITYYGVLDTNDQTVTCDEIDISSTYTRELDLGSSIINCNYWNLGTKTNFTLTEGTSSIRINTTNDFVGNSETYYEVQLNSTANVITGTNTFTNLIRTGTATKTDTLTLNANQTITGTLTLNGNSATNRLLVQSNTPATYRTLTCNGSISASNVDFLDIQGAGAASWDLSAISGGSGNVGHNSGITFTTATNRYWVDNSGLWSATTHWSTTSGGGSGASVPLCQDTAIFDANSITIDSRVIQLDMPRIGNIDCEEAERYPQFDGNGSGGGDINLYGDVIFGDVNWTPTNTYFYGRSTQSITSNGNQFDSTVYLYNYDAVWHIEDDFITTGIVYHRAGTLNMQGLRLTCYQFNSQTTTYTRSIAWQGGEFYLTYVSPSWIVASTNLTIGVNTGDIKFSPTSGNATFTSGGFTTYNNIYVQGSTNYTLTLTAAFTCNNFIVLRDEAAKTISGNYTITMNGGFYCPVSGTTVVTITNTDFSKASGIVSTDYLSLTGSAAAGGASFYAGINSTNNGGNSGWIFDGPTPPSVTTSAVSDATRDSAYFNAHVVTLGSWTEVLLFYQYNNSGNWTLDYDETEPELVTVQGDYEKFVEDLTPLSHYYVRAVLNFNEYDYVYGSNVEFYTTGQPVVVTGAASEITTISARLNGTLTTLGEYASCDVYFKYGLVELALDKSTTPVTKTERCAFDAQVLDLKAGYTYYFAAYVNYGGGSTAYGTTEEFDTMASYKPTTPTAKTTDDIVIGDIILGTEPLGPVIGDSLDAGGSLFGADGRGFGGFLCFLLFLAIMIPLSAKGYPIAGLGFGFAGGILLGAGLGLIHWAVIGVLVFLAALIWVVKHWLRW